MDILFWMITHCLGSIKRTLEINPSFLVKIQNNKSFLALALIICYHDNKVHHDMLFALTLFPFEGWRGIVYIHETKSI